MLDQIVIPTKALLQAIHQLQRRSLVTGFRRNINVPYNSFFFTQYLLIIASSSSFLMGLVM